MRIKDYAVVGVVSVGLFFFCFELTMFLGEFLGSFIG